MRNSVLIAISSLSSAALGFAFWLVAARNYSSSDIGYSSALISAVSLILILSRFGLEHSLIRHFPEGDKSKIFSSTFAVTSAFSLILGVIVVIQFSSWIPEMHNGLGNSVVFILILIPSSFISLAGTTYIAMRRPELNIVQTLAMYARILFLIPLVSYGAWGIFGSLGLSLFIATILSGFILYDRGLRLVRIDVPYLRDSLRYSLANYSSEIFYVAPLYTLPILIAGLLGPERAALYYVAYLYYALVLVIPLALSSSLFVEGSHGENLKSATKTALVLGFGFCLLASAFVWFKGDSLLGLLGDIYVEALSTLKVLALSSVLASIHVVYCARLRVERAIKMLVSLNLTIFVVVMTASLLMIDSQGILGVAYAWLSGYSSSVALIFISTVLKRTWI